MRAAVVVYPGSNCDRDLAVALRATGQIEPVMVWHKDTSLPERIDLVGLPGGFSWGDYLRCGAIAARAPITRAVVEFAARGGPVLGICNGFQILCEAGLLPGALIRNAGMTFVCRNVALSVETADSPFTARWGEGAAITLPIAHHDGNYVADPDTLATLEGEGRVALRYKHNPNGSLGAIAGVLSDNRRVLGLMPHPERAIAPELGSQHGAALFEAVAEAFATA